MRRTPPDRRKGPPHFGPDDPLADARDLADTDPWDEERIEAATDLLCRAGVAALLAAPDAQVVRHMPPGTTLPQIRDALRMLHVERESRRRLRSARRRRKPGKSGFPRIGG